MSPGVVTLIVLGIAGGLGWGAAGGLAVALWVSLRWRAQEEDDPRPDNRESEPAPPPRAWPVAKEARP